MEPVPYTAVGPPAWVEWGGQRWYLNGRDGYYRNRAGALMHRAVYEATHGPIPDDWHVHHVDDDRLNNRPGNLEALTPGEHQRRHEPRGFLLMSPEALAERARRAWQKRQPRDLVCAQCGSNFQSTGMRAKFCRPACREADRRDRLAASSGT
jgi:hypothetical protein